MAVTKVRVWNPLTGLEEDMAISLDLSGNKPTYTFFTYDETDSIFKFIYKYECYPAIPFASNDQNYWRIRLTKTQIEKTTGNVVSIYVLFPNGNTGYNFSAELAETYTYFYSPDFE
jgi:hypothetical protein